MQHLHNKYDKDLYRSFNDGSRVFCTLVKGNFLAENQITKDVQPVQLIMLIIFDYQADIKKLDISISDVLVDQDEKGFVFKDKAEINDLAEYLKTKLLGLYACSLF